MTVLRHRAVESAAGHFRVVPAGVLDCLFPFPMVERDNGPRRPLDHRVRDRPRLVELRGEIDKWALVIRTAGIKPE